MTEMAPFEAFFRSVPAGIDVEAIRRDWQALQPSYNLRARRLPRPVWARHGYADDGPAAWGTLQRELAGTVSGRPLSIYIHVPFCADKCDFCDCYSFRLGQHTAEHIGKYLALLEQEIQIWSRLGDLARRPVTTIHFGGGTPTFLGEAQFTRLVQACRKAFNTSPQTEWALETTSSELTEVMLACLEDLGFTRLHVGVQSLEDAIRARIGRREPGAVALEKLARAVAQGWVTSVDLIFGLPGQTSASLLEDIRRIAGAGVNGFSMYELQRSPRNMPFIRENDLAQRDRTLDYFLLHCATQALTGLGYRKTLFNHFADARDTDLYFTFPERDEDCLAIGTIADGVFDGYHYRHPAYAAYGKAVSPVFPGLEGGVRQSPAEGRLAALETAILSARLTLNKFSEILGEEKTQRLFERWSQAALIRGVPGEAGQYLLTANGSWLTGEMMAELADPV